MYLHVQQYLRGGKTLDDLQRKHAIEIYEDSKYPLVCLNYNQIASDFTHPIPCECRGLILEKDTWNVISRSFSKFFNYHEPSAKAIIDSFDWNSTAVTEKLDGSLVLLYYYEGDWRVATRGTTDAQGPLQQYNSTFADLIYATLNSMGFSFDKLYKDIFYSLELTSPFNSPVIRQYESKLTWLAAWDKKTLIELPINGLPDIGLPRVPVLPFTSYEKLIESTLQQPISRGEGVVICDKNFNRLKIKSMDYVRAHRVATSLQSSERNRIALLLSPTYDDTYGMLPDSFKQDMDALKSKLNKVTLAVLKTFDSIKDLPTQKEFALEAVKYPYKAMLFELRKGKPVDAVLRNLTPEYVETILEGEI